jgi:hypothetical protein
MGLGALASPHHRTGHFGRNLLLATRMQKGPAATSATGPSLTAVEQ